MDQGLITNPKDLERMQHELESLERRITSLEDDELEVMARVEDAERTLTELTGQVEEIERTTTDLEATRDEKLSGIDRELGTLDDERGSALEGLPADLLALYEKLRAAKGGVGAAELRARECGGCRLAIDAAELASIRAAAPELVIRCEECQRILVRTDESGL